MAKQQSFLTASAVSLLLIGSATAVIPAPGYAAQILLTDEEKVQVRMDEEARTASLDKSYAKQQRKLAKDYKQLATLVEKQGGDPTQLLDAADYFDSKADKQEKKEKKEKNKKN